MKRVSDSVVVVCLVGLLSCCTEEIDTSARYVFTQNTVFSYLTKGSHSEDFTEYVELLKQVPMGDLSSSTVSQLLSARGNYTVFAPTNAAICEYLDTLYARGLIEKPSWEGFRDERTLDSIRKVIVYNSIIDGGNDVRYQTVDFPNKDNDEFQLANMNDRRLPVRYAQSDADSIYVNVDCPLDANIRDVQLLNGVLHQVHKVIAPSNDTMADFIKRNVRDLTTQYLVMSRLLMICGMEDTLGKVRDEVWETLY